MAEIANMMAGRFQDAFGVKPMPMSRMNFAQNFDPTAPIEQPSGQNFTDPNAPKPPPNPILLEILQAILGAARR